MFPENQSGFIGCAVIIKPLGYRAAECLSIICNTQSGSLKLCIKGPSGDVHWTLAVTVWYIALDNCRDIL